MDLKGLGLKEIFRRVLLMVDFGSISGVFAIKLDITILLGRLIFFFRNNYRRIVHIDLNLQPNNHLFN